jgi:hypothetical protein
LVDSCGRRCVDMRGGHLAVLNADSNSGCLSVSNLAQRAMAASLVTY